MEVEGPPRALCLLIIKALKKKFKYELEESSAHIVRPDRSNAFQSMISIFDCLNFFMKAAAVLKVNGLKFWIGTAWSTGYFTNGLNAIQAVGERLLFGSRSPEQVEIEIEPAQLHLNALPSTPGLRTPSTAGSENFYRHFFETDGDMMDVMTEVKKREFANEVEKFKSFISKNNFEIIDKIRSSSFFWRKNSRIFPQLSKLVLILNTIPSTSACIERYFSICGFVDKKNSSNISPDLFVTRCLLRANLEILKELTVTCENEIKAS